MLCLWQCSSGILHILSSTPTSFMHFSLPVKHQFDWNWSLYSWFISSLLSRGWSGVWFLFHLKSPWNKWQTTGRFRSLNKSQTASQGALSNYNLLMWSSTSSLLHITAPLFSILASKESDGEWTSLLFDWNYNLLLVNLALQHFKPVYLFIFTILSAVLLAWWLTAVSVLHMQQDIN